MVYLDLEILKMKPNRALISSLWLTDYGPFIYGGSQRYFIGLRLCAKRKEKKQK